MTGAAGFIGGNFSRYLAEQEPGTELVLLDKLSRYSTMGPIRHLTDSGRARFVKLDLADHAGITELFRQEEFDAVVNFAAESHNDRAIVEARPFIDSNVTGAYNLLAAASVTGVRRVVHISTIEVYGEQADDVPWFTEGSPLNAKTPYSASKAAADLIVRAHMQTHPGLDVAITHCANNYGPWQFPEKLVPLAITNLLRGLRVPLYGDGLQRRDWLHVLDHCRGVKLVLDRPEGVPLHPEAATRPELLPIYDFSARQELTNRQIIKLVTDAMDLDFDEWAESVPDRPNHDRRYLINPAKAEAELGFRPTVGLEQGMEETVRFYIENRSWWEDILRNNPQGLQFNWAAVPDASRRRS